MRGKTLLASFAVFAAFAFAQAVADLYFIDSFTDPMKLTVHGSDGPTEAQVIETGLAGVLGGNRTVTLTSFGTRGVATEVISNGMSLFIDSQAKGGADLNIEYTPNLPLSIVGVGKFQMEVDYTDIAGYALPVQVTLQTGTGTATNSQMVSGVGVYEWHFHEFVSSETIAWDDIRSISLDFIFSDGDGDGKELTSVDIEFAPFTVLMSSGTVAIVPAPASLLLVFLGLGTLMVRKRP